MVEQGLIALAVGAGGGCLDIFFLIYLFSFLSPSLWETARYRLKFCLKGPLNPKQFTKNTRKRKSLQTDGRTDAEGYNIMRPFIKQAYKNYKAVD